MNLFFKLQNIISCYGYFFDKIKQNVETDDNSTPSHEEEVNFVIEYSSFGSLKERILDKKNNFKIMKLYFILWKYVKD